MQPHAFAETFGTAGVNASVDLIGRGPQMAELIARRKAAARGHPSVVLVCGEAGCGKTRLLETFATRLTSGRADAVWLRPKRSARDAQTAARIREIANRVDSGKRRTMVIFVEDVHAAALDVLDAVRELAEPADARRRLVVVSFRPIDDEDEPARPIRLAQLARTEGAVTLEIEPLGPSETRALVRAFARGHAVLDPATVDAIAERSGGNPLVVRELVKCASDEFGAARSRRPVPLSLGGLVAEWLAPFSGDDRSVLAHAALRREGFRVSDVADLVARPAADVSPVFRRALARGLIAEGHGDAHTYVFRWPIVADVLEHRFLAHEKRGLHRRIAQSIEAHGAIDERAGELAKHWLAAGDPGMAAMYANRSGDASLAAGRYRDAARWYELALASPASPSHGGGDLHVKLAQARDISGDALGAHEALRTAAAFLDVRGDTEAGLRVRLHDALIAQHQSDLPAGFARLESATRFGLQSTSRAYAQAVAAFLLALRQETDRALDHLAAFPKDDSETDRAALRKYWEAIAFLAVQRCDEAAFDEAAAHYLEEARRTGDAAVVTAAESDVAISMLHFAGDACDAFLERAVALSVEHGLPWIESYTRAFAALNDFVRGRLESGRRHLEAMLEIETNMPMVAVARTYAGISIGRALCDQKLLDLCARSDLVELALGTGIPSVYGRTAGPYAQHLVDVGRVEEACALLSRCVRGLRSAYGTFLTMPVVAQYADEPDIAIARRLLAAATRNGNDRIASATLALFDAIRHARAGRLDASLRCGRKAAERYRSLRWTNMEARATEVAGDRLEALRLYRRCGNVRELRRLELAAPRVEPPTGAVGGGALSSRERQITRLVAAGTSNRSIAMELGVSEKTVERHLTAIFKRLGFRSRTELAAAVARGSPRH